MRKPIRVGVVGCGYWGPNLIRNFQALTQCELKAMCDLNETRLTHLQRLYPGTDACTDFAHLVNGAGLDAVAIATSVRQHFVMARQSLLAGKHTLIEKPMASSSAECEELIDIARSKGLVLMVGHTFLYSAAIRRLKEIVDSGSIGELRYISARRLNLGLFQKDINVAWDLAPHDLSIILHVLGEFPCSVNCQGQAHLTPGIEDVTTMALSFSRNRFATIQNSWLDPRKVREMTIVGSRQMIVYDDVAPIEKLRIYDVRVECPPHYDTFGEFQYAYHYGDCHIPYVQQEEPLKVQCQHFVECIRHGRAPLSDGVQGLQLVRILEAASRSLRQNGASIRIESASDDFIRERPVLKAQAG